jgi:hypothetical protein
MHSSQCRTLLLFVIRDHIGVTPLANLQATLNADLTNIWDSLSKPQDLQDRKLSDYFDLSFTALPSNLCHIWMRKGQPPYLRAPWTYYPARLFALLDKPCPLRSD